MLAAAQADRRAGKTAAEARWAMPWPEFEVTFGLKNAYSLRNLNLKQPDAAQLFLSHCGFDLSLPDHRKSYEQFTGEALFLIRHALMTAEERAKYPVPAEILSGEDPLRLVTLASQRAPRRRYVRLWACSLLKVMNAISNVEHSGRVRVLEAAREQIFSRIRGLSETDPRSGRSFLRHEGLAVPVKSIDWKEAKTRNSIILKLLHKPDTIVDEVFDYLGVRFVVERLADVAKLVRLLIRADIVIPHQVVGPRSRNTLIDLRGAKHLLGVCADLFSMGIVDDEEFEAMCERVDWAPPFGPELHSTGRVNAFSSPQYRSVQLTVRHLVRFPNPAHQVIDALTRQLRQFKGVDREDPGLSAVVPRELSLYFPLEIQIMDAGSYDQTRFGPASHEQYKAAQLKAVRERVLSGMLFLNDEKMATQEY